MSLAAACFLLIASCFAGGAAPPQAASSPAEERRPQAVHELARLRPGCWAALGKNTLCDVRYVPEPGGRPIGTIMTAWSGAAFDTDRCRLLVHGGGHGDGADNAVYAFDVPSLEWIRLFDPSTVVSGHSGRYYLDGKPAAVHSYDCVEYLPSLGRLIVAGACGPFPSANLYPTVDAVDSAGDWIRLLDAPSSIHPMAAVHPDTGVLWHHGGEGAGFLSSLDPVTGTWTPHGDSMTDNLPGCWRTAAIDPVHDLFVAVNIAGDSIWAWSLSTGVPGGEIKGQKEEMTGDTSILEAEGAPGLDWDPVRKKLYAWYGGTDVFEIDMGRLTITRVPLSPRNTVVPTPGTPNGVYGRWRYVPGYDVFMGVNSVYEKVFFFRLPD